MRHSRSSGQRHRALRVLERQILNRFFRNLIATTAVAIVAPYAAAQNAAAQVKNGEYLATAANCISCHTVPGSAPFTGGVSFSTKFGKIYSTNITPDTETGIGRWTATQFKRAMQEGVDDEGQHLYPAFPYTAFTKISDADVDAIFVYLRSVKPVKYRAPQNDLIFPFNQRAALGEWKSLYLDNKRFVPNAAKPAEWNRGAYLVEALGHCSACHTPRNLMGAERTDMAFTGGTYKDKVRGGQIRNWSAVNLTSAHTGLKTWTVDELAAYLKTGLSPYATTFGPMNEVIMNSTRHLSNADVRAMAVYLKSLPAKEQSPNPKKPNKEDMQLGAEVYSVHCGTCHLPTGKGSIDTGPSMVGNPVVQAEDPASLINVILYGPELPTPAPPAQRMHMEAYADTLDDEEIAALATYLRNTWGNRAAPVDADRVAEQR